MSNHFCFDFKSSFIHLLLNYSQNLKNFDETTFWPQFSIDCISALTRYFCSIMVRLGSTPVLDLGSFSVKAGFVGESYPLLVFPRENHAPNPWPIERGVITNWDALQKVCSNGKRTWSSFFFEWQDLHLCIFVSEMCFRDRRFHYDVSISITDSATPMLCMFI